MSLSARTLAMLVGAGLGGDDLVAVVRAIEEDFTSPSRSVGAERQRRYRERKAGSNVTRDVTRDVTVSVTPPPSKEIPPGPPKETQPPSSEPEGSSDSCPAGRTKAPQPRLQPSKGELDGIWEITPRIARERSSRKDLERSLTAAMRRGHDPEAIRQALLAAYASGSFSGDHAKGVHRLIENDRWQSFTELIEASNVVPLDRDALEARQRAIAEWAEQQAKGAANV